MLHSQSQIIDAAKAAQSCSYYKIAQVLGITQPYMYQLRHGHALLSQGAALKLANLAKMEPGYVLACIEHERAARSENLELSGAWKVVARKFDAAKVAPLALVILALFSAATLTSESASAAGQSIHYAKSAATLAALFGHWFHARLLAGLVRSAP